jgi:sulfur-oxidizing protein SoxX
MRKTATIIAATSTALLLLGSLTLVRTVSAAEEIPSADAVARGKQVAEDRLKGNCQSCHDYKGASMAGTIGPALGGWLQQKYKSKADLRAQIWDASKANPGSTMIPFGKNEVLTEAEVDAVTDWTWTLK